MHITGITSSEIIEHERAIREAITRIYIDPTGKAQPIYDGVVDPSVYCAAPARILWILKEPWDEDDCSGGGWSIAHDLLNIRATEMAKKRTFQPIIYTTYGIFNRIWNWDDMPYIRDAPEIALLLRSIAFINAKKLPGFKRSNNEQILTAYNAAREVILRQIHAYDPDYIFACRPHISAILHDLGVLAADIKTHESLRYARIGRSTYFDVYHPGQTTITRDRYINDILQVVASLTK